MFPFKRSFLGTAHTLGERLRQVRQETGLSLEEVAARTGVRQEHLKALEEGRYADLPGEVYAKNFVRSYARVLNVREELALKLLDQEIVVSRQVKPSQPIAPPAPIEDHIPASPHNLRRAFVILLGIAVLLYLASEVARFTSAPRLTILTPPEELTTQERTIELFGVTEPETVVTANGKPVMVDRSGRFREVLDLQDGLNTIVVQAHKKRGKATTSVRNILVQLP